MLEKLVDIITIVCLFGTLICSIYEQRIKKNPVKYFKTCLPLLERSYRLGRSFRYDDLRQHLQLSFSSCFNTKVDVSEDLNGLIVFQESLKKVVESRDLAGASEGYGLKHRTPGAPLRGISNMTIILVKCMSG